MNTEIYNTAAQIEISRWKSVPDNSEEYAQKYGHILVPGLRDRFALRLGLLLIKMGKKLTADGSKNLNLSRDMA